MKIAVIGCGYWGKNLARNFFELDVLYMVCDSDADKLKLIQNTYPSIQVTTNLIDVLTNKEVGAVAIATPAGTHYQIARECILSGKDVFVEKPLSLTVNEGVELVELAERKNKLLMVGHLLEYHI